MLFLLPIPVTLVLGLIWAAWVSRPPRPADPTTTVEEWTRAVRVLATPPAAPRPQRAERELVRSA
ncbi:MAG TPA: hypothetical protein VNQ77_02735 [Frankiaceae bacterium]|nr:hypothetical protein [Frankiaceae bacterium]